VGEIARWDDQKKRRVFRPHWEDREGITSDEEILWREELARLLDRLLGIELAISTGCRQRDDEEPNVVRVRGLLETPAIARFIGDYDIFGVRFLVARYGISLPGLNRLQAPREIWRDDEDPGRAEGQDAVGAFFRQRQKFDQDLGMVRFRQLLGGFKIKGLDRPLRDEFRQWLQGIPLEIGEPIEQVFREAREAGIRWCREKAKLYKQVPLPGQARFAIHDFYWLVQLFGAEVSAAGAISYPREEWFKDLAKGDAAQKEILMDARRVFTEAGSLACNWIQGTPFEPGPEPPAGDQRMPLEWNQVYEEELREIAKYRQERPEEPAEDLYTVRRNLVGLAFSGGGIRSATFNLGVLEALKSYDLLRRIDYLSTVSGGGYIGSWLVANAYRRRGWLRRASDWGQSIWHLRRHSNYLAPKVGILSPDTWTIAAIWFRNTLLMQVLVLLVLAWALLLPHSAKLGFDQLSGPLASPLALGAGGAAELSGRSAGAFFLLGATVAFIAANLWRIQTWGQARAQGFIVVPMILSAFLFAGILWAHALSATTPFLEYSQLLRNAWRWWWAPGWWFAGFLLALSLSTVDIPAALAEKRTRRWVFAVLTAVAAAVVALVLLYLESCGIVKLFLSWQQTDRPQNRWYVFTFGPSLVAWSFALTVVLVVGLLSRASSEEKREWWSRLGAWLMIYGAVWMALALAGIFAPLWVALLPGWKSQIGSALAWVAATAGGLMAGKSSSTGGNGATAAGQKAQEWVAQVAPYVFVAGLVAGLSSALHAILLYATDNWPDAGQYVSQYWRNFDRIPWSALWMVWLGVALAAALYARRLDINIFSLNNFYRNRLVRCYLGATRDPARRKEHPFTRFDPGDEIFLKDLRFAQEASRRAPFTGPFPIVNCALNLGGSSDLSVHTRQSASFTLTPLHAGADRRRPDPSGAIKQHVGFAPLLLGAKPYYAGSEGGPMLGQAISVSGAAANPNMGFHTSRAVAFLLTLFNVRLGWWFPSPSKRAVQRASPKFAILPLLRELFGSANDERWFLNISDGGHFENLGVYELVRRRCRVIIASDAECDADLAFGSLGNVIRMCEADFGAKIDIDVSAIRKKPGSEFSTNHCAVGRISYRDGSEGRLIYMKASLIDDEDTAVLQYKKSHPAFPHETTADQFFTEDQFDSYRLLGRDVAARTFRDAHSGSFAEIALRLQDLWTPNPDVSQFTSHADALVKLWSQMKSDADLLFLSDEVFRGHAAPPRHSDQALKALLYCNEVLQLMENLFLELELDDTAGLPDNAGWMDLFKKWANAPTFRKAWTESRQTYGKRFRYFCERELGLPYGGD
jgi:hypothetical protein